MREQIDTGVADFNNRDLDALMDFFPNRFYYIGDGLPTVTDKEVSYELKYFDYCNYTIVHIYLFATFDIYFN